MTLHSLPLFVRLAGRPVILLGHGDAADAKRRLLARAGATIVGEEADAALAVVALEHGADDAAARLRARGILVNVVDRPELCDFTMPALIDRDPVLVAIGTGGVSAGLAAALRQRLEALLPASLGELARALHAARSRLRASWPDAATRRRALAAAMAAGAPLDPLGSEPDVARWLSRSDAGQEPRLVRIRLRSDDPDDLTLREARALASADRIYHRPGVPAPILDRARADAPRIESAAPIVDPPAGITVDVERA